jgi:hypothetical protein
VAAGLLRIVHAFHITGDVDCLVAEVHAGRLGDRLDAATIFLESHR